MKKKLLLFSSVFIFIVTCAFLIFWDDLEKGFLDSYIQKNFKRKLHADFQYEQATKEEDGWNYKNLIISNEQGLLIIAPLLKIDYSIEWLKGNLDLNLALNQPTIILPEKMEFLPEENSHSLKSTSYLPKLFIFKITGKLDVDNGIIALNSNSLNPIQFRLKGEWDSVAPHFFLQTWQHDFSHAANQSSIIFTNKNGLKTLDIDLKGIDCSISSDIVKLLPEETAWKIDEGILNGHVRSTWMEGEDLTIAGELSLQDLHVENSDLKLKGFLSKAICHFKNKTAELQLEENSFIKFKDNNLTISQIKGGALFSQNHPAKIAIEGKCHFANEEYPLKILGEVNQLLNPNHQKLAQLQIETFYKNNLLVCNLSCQSALNGFNILGDIDYFSKKIHFGGHATLDSNFWPWILKIPQAELTKGWIKLENLSLTEVKDSFALPADLAGTLNLNGHFNNHHISVDYELNHFSLQMNDLAFLHPNGSLRGVYYFDLLSKSNGAIVNIADGTMVLKGKNPLQFLNIQSTVFLNNENFYTDKLECYFENVYLSSALKGFYNSSDWALDLNLETLNLTIPQLKDLLAHFNASIPLPLKALQEGDLTLQQNGAFLHLEKHADKKLIASAEVFGTLSQAAFEKKIDHIQMPSFFLNFSYQYPQNSLKISELKGILFFGSSEYILAANQLHFENLLKYDTIFDIWIGDKNHDYLRVAGKTETASPSTFKLTLNPEHSHLGMIHPKVFELMIQNWQRILSAKVDFGFKLDTLLEELISLSDGEILTLHPTVHQYLEKIGMVHGDLQVNLEYEDTSDLLSFKVAGQNLSLNQFELKSLQAHGYKKGSTWSLEQFKSDDISASTEFTKVDSGWKINFLGLQLGKDLLLGLDGQYDKSTSKWNLHINLFDLDLQGLARFPALTKFNVQCCPEGHVKAFGEITVDSNDLSKFSVDANLNTSWHHFKLLSVPLKDAENVPFQIKSNKILFQKFASGLRDLFDFELASFEHDLKSHETFIKDLHFHIPAKQILPVYELMQKNFGEILPKHLENLFKSNVRDIKGHADITANSSHHVLSLSLDPQFLHFENFPFTFNQFDLRKDPLEVTVQAAVIAEEIPYKFLLRTAWPKADSGSLKCSQDDAKHLTIYWHHNDSKGFVIQKVDGSLSGLQASLLKKENSDLDGEIAIDMDKAMLPSSLKQVAKDWNLQGKYVLKGLWSFKDPFTGPFSFNGMLEGKNCAVNGCLFDQMNCTIKIDPKNILMQNVYLGNSSGAFLAKSMTISQNEDLDWLLAIPQIVGNHILLDTAGENQGWVIRKIELNDFHGSLHDTKSFQGQGTFTFINNAKVEKKIHLPNEELSQLGLQKAMLAPVTGTVSYKIADAKIYITKLKDVYSPGKLSKFYLADDKEMTSYIDFLGNLNLNVRVKQYSLMMKLAELFIISVEGPWRTPSIHLEKLKD